MVFMPPRHGKSECVSRLFPAYYLLKHPDRYVGVTSYDADLAYMFSRNARDNYQRGGGVLSPAAAAVSLWETGKGGGLWAAGVGGGITGKGFSLGIIDDPIKNAEEAQSSTIREKQKDWYRSAFYTRQEPGAAIVLVQTRWHQDDLAGWLLDQESDKPERWHVIDLPAIAELPKSYPASCTVEPDRREIGEPLCPQRFPLPALQKIEAALGSFWWSAEYQQRPYARTGGLFQRQWFQIVDAAPAGLRPIRFWDLAATEAASGKDPDYTAGALVAIKDGVYYILDMRRIRATPMDVESLIKQTAALDGRLVPIYIEQEGGASGKFAIDTIVRTVLTGYAARGEPVSRAAKATRADPVSSAAQAGNVRLRRGTWCTAMLDEFELFPQGTHDDQVDAVSGAVSKLTGGGWALGPASR